jgi:hypothetical protein
VQGERRCIARRASVGAVVAEGDEARPLRAPKFTPLIVTCCPADAVAGDTEVIAGSGSSWVVCVSAAPVAASV